jgi:hypothetical protein
MLPFFTLFNFRYLYVKPMFNNWMWLDVAGEFNVMSPALRKRIQRGWPRTAHHPQFTVCRIECGCCQTPRGHRCYCSCTASWLSLMCSICSATYFEV